MSTDPSPEQFQAQYEKMRDGRGFIAALDQSGGSTPKALALYGIDEGSYSGKEEMFRLVHAMRARIITSSAFDDERILAAILFEQTLDRQIDGVDTAAFLWNHKNIVPILKVDQGLASEVEGVQLMKPMPDLDALLDRALAKGVFGTKMRSVIHSADAGGIQAIVDQQFGVGGQILERGLVPILEPEVDIHADDKAESERWLKTALLAGLDAVPDDQQVMFKLSLPSVDDFYSDLVGHPKVLRVVALSGGYSRQEANALLAKNPGVVASFSRALSEGLSVDQTDDDFDELLDQSIQSIFNASTA